MLTDEEVNQLVLKAHAGDHAAMNRLFSEYREPLRKMIHLRLDDRVKGRGDASDVIQEAHLNIWKALPTFMADQPIPFRLWLRLQVNEQVVKTHRRHLHAQQRDAHREVNVNGYVSPGSNSFLLASLIAETGDTPSEQAMRIELVTACESPWR